MKKVGALVVTLFGFFLISLLFESEPIVKRQRGVGSVGQAAKLAMLEVPKARTDESFLSAKPTARSTEEAVELWIREGIESGRLASHHSPKVEWSESPLGAIARVSYAQDEIAIVGMETRLRVGRDFSVTVEGDTYHSIAQFESRAGLSSEQVQAKLVSRYTLREGSEGDLSLIYYFDPENRQGELAYGGGVIDAHTRDRLQVIVRASDGFILRRIHARSEFSARPIFR